MTRSLSITLSLCALLVSGAFLFVCWKLSAALDTTRQAAWNVSALAWNSQPTVQHVNEATDVWAKSSQKQADAADELIRDLRVEAWHLDKTMTNVNDQMEHVGPLLDSLRDEAVELRRTTVAATGTLDEGKRTIHALQPVLGHADAAAEHLDAILQDRNIPDTLANVQAVTQNAAGISLDARRAADEATADYLKPVPWWKQPIKRFGEAWDIGAAFARHAP